jgi:hypothetical protein
VQINLMITGFEVIEERRGSTARGDRSTRMVWKGGGRDGVVDRSARVDALDCGAERVMWVLALRTRATQGLVGRGELVDFDS